MINEEMEKISMKRAIIEVHNENIAKWKERKENNKTRNKNRNGREQMLKAMGRKQLCPINH